VSGTKYPANRSVVSWFSPAISSALDSHDLSAPVPLAVADPHHLFEFVIGFLHGGQLDLTPSNVFPYSALARSLDIAALSHALEPELTRETDFDNAMPRLIHCDFEPLSIFFLQNIEKL
jgi:hypothetical protein